MKAVNRIFNIIIIFIILQMFGIIITNSVYADSFFENVFDTGRAYKEKMGSNYAQDIIKNEANEVFSVTDEIYNTVRLIGASLCLLAFVVIVIGLNTGKIAMDKAYVKLSLGITVVLAIMFIFSQQILDWIVEMLEKFEGTM